MFVYFFRRGIIYRKPYRTSGKSVTLTLVCMRVLKEQLPNSI